MSGSRKVALIALGLGLLAGGSRFYKLADWPFYGDELATFQETDHFEHTGADDKPSQLSRLPKLIPITYFIQNLGYECFGRDEFGSRVLPALLGVIHVVLVFVLLTGPLGRPTALATALLIALWPEHIHRSQENRFYMTACVVASLCMLSGAQAIQRRSMFWFILAIQVAGAALFTHTLLGALWGGLFLGFFAAARVAADGQLRRWAWWTLGSAGLVLAGSAVYIIPLATGWNNGESWGYSPAASLLAAISQLGWPVAILAGVGAIAALQSPNEQDWYWLSWGATWFISSALLPCVVMYHPAYVFPMSLGILVLAGRGVARIYEGLSLQSSWAATAWVGLACLLNFPSLLSHYADGDCYDYRGAAQFISKHWQDGDRALSFSPTLLKHYCTAGIEPNGMSMSDPLSAVKRASAGAKRIWIVVPSPRAGKSEPLASWLSANCSMKLHIQKRRIDYYDNIVEVYVYIPRQQL
jgi:hypothetical protein